jgi:hypothetical protein
MLHGTRGNGADVWDANPLAGPSRLRPELAISFSV